MSAGRGSIVRITDRAVFAELGRNRISALSDALGGPGYRVLARSDAFADVARQTVERLSVLIGLVGAVCAALGSGYLQTEALEVKLPNRDRKSARMNS
jgi:hypothetical protein